MTDSVTDLLRYWLPKSAAWGFPPPDPAVSVLEIPTLDVGVSRALSPMLRERFEFCGEWEVGPGGMRWYSAASLAEHRTYLAEAVEENLDAHGDRCLFVGKAASELSVLAETDWNLITAHWVSGAAEPAILLHHGSNVEEFPNLRACLQWYKGDQ